MSGLPNNLIAASLVNAYSSLAFVRDSLRAGDVSDQCVRTLDALAGLMGDLDVAVPGAKSRDADRTYEHDPLCDDGWNHHGPCILDIPVPT